VQAASARPLGEVLVSLGLVSSPEMTEALLEQLGRRVAKDEAAGSALWSDIRRRTSRRLTTIPGSAEELNRRISRLTENLADARLALDQERAAAESARAEVAATRDRLEAAEKRIGELTATVDRLQTERSKRSQGDARWRQTITRALFGAELHLAKE